MLARIGSRNVQQIVGKLVSKAKAGDIAAAREVLDRSIGKAKQSVELEATAHTEQDEQKPLDHWGRMRKAFNFYIMFMVPKRAWILRLIGRELDLHRMQVSSRARHQNRWTYAIADSFHA
ncbi:MAG: hypothetical protein NTU53_11330 [Planctomycetota bacterium]|nr:hypothetical protein [Planctomycetota bacterium]